MSAIAILGAGPTALMAAYAVERNGHEPVLYSRDPEQAHVNADMFLYRALPDLADQEQFRLEIHRWGSRGGYAEKVYGERDAKVSWDELPFGTVVAWWLKPTYDLLWERYKGAVQPLDVNGYVAQLLLKQHPLVMSTLPAPAVCVDPTHAFSDKPTWLARYWDELADLQRHPNQMLYNGDVNYGSKWFRYTCLNGWRTWEYAVVPPSSEVTSDTPILPGKKFLSNTCDCHPALYRVGRWAQWKRGVLNHHAFEQATSILASAGLGKGA